MDTVFLYHFNVFFNKAKNRIYVLALLFSMIFSIIIPNYSKSLKTEEDRINTLILLKIIEDAGNLDTNVTRAEFSKILVRASEDRDKVSDTLSEAVCNDVSIDTPYAAYIKKTIDRGYMFTYLGGLFKPYDYVTFDDLSRACLALLSYTNDDFRGNQVIGRNLKFRSLGLAENIDKADLEALTKIDIINGIYNTLKENVKDSDDVYGQAVFDKLIIDSDKELNASEYKESKIEGPFVAKNESELDIPFEITKHNVYINAISASIDELKDDIVNFGYAIYYLDLDNKSVVAYTERQDVSSPVVLRKGYIYKIYYAASNMLIPYRVDIDNYKYMLDSEEAKFSFSANGKYREDDYVIYLCNKMNDISSIYLDENGKTVYKSDEAEPYNGSIILVFHANSILRWLYDEKNICNNSSYI